MFIITNSTLNTVIYIQKQPILFYKHTFTFKNFGCFKLQIYKIVLQITFVNSLKFRFLKAQILVSKYINLYFKTVFKFKYLDIIQLFNPL